MRCNKVGMKTPRITRNLREIVEGECLVAVQGTDLDEDSPHVQKDLWIIITGVIGYMQRKSILSTLCFLLPPTNIWRDAYMTTFICPL